MGETILVAKGYATLANKGIISTSSSEKIKKEYQKAFQYAKVALNQAIFLAYA